MKIQLTKKEIQEKFGLPECDIEIITGFDKKVVEEIGVLPEDNEDNYITVTFPNKTAKEIVDECNNKLGNGKLLYDPSWYKNEDFYTKEKPRKGTWKISTKIDHLGKLFNECKEEGLDMLSFVELLWVAIIYYSITDKYFFKDYYSWTKSLASDGDFVLFGFFGGTGASVYGSRPGTSDSNVGLSFSVGEIK